MTETTDVDTTSFHSAAVDLVERHGCTVRWIANPRGLPGEFPAERAQAWVERRAIECELPRTPGQFAVFCHELGHVLMGEQERQNGLVLPQWRREIRASRLALRLHRELGFRGYDEAAYRLGRHLHGYLAHATAAGEATPAEVRRLVEEDELLPYGSELGVAVELRSEDDLVAPEGPAF